MDLSDFPKLKFLHAERTLVLVKLELFRTLTS